MHTRTGTCTHRQNTDKALITPRGVDWESLTAERTSFLPMRLTSVKKLITCLAVKLHTHTHIIYIHPRANYLWHSKQSINAGSNCITKLTKTINLHCSLCDGDTHLASFLNPMARFFVGVPLTPFHTCVFQGSGCCIRKEKRVQRTWNPSTSRYRDRPSVKFVAVEL